MVSVKYKKMETETKLFLFDWIICVVNEWILFTALILHYDGNFDPVLVEDRA